MIKVSLSCHQEKKAFYSHSYMYYVKVLTWTDDDNRHSPFTLIKTDAINYTQTKSIDFSNTVYLMSRMKVCFIGGTEG